MGIFVLKWFIEIMIDYSKNIIISLINIVIKYISYAYLYQLLL